MSPPWPQIGDTVCITATYAGRAFKAVGTLFELLPHGVRLRFEPPLKFAHGGGYELWSEMVHWPHMVLLEAAPGEAHRIEDDDDDENSADM